MVKNNDKTTIDKITFTITYKDIPNILDMSKAKNISRQNLYLILRIAKDLNYDMVKLNISEIHKDDINLLKVINNKVYYQGIQLLII